MKKLVLIFLIIGTILASSCRQKEPQKEYQKEKITDYGHGVYFFKLNNEDFPIVLSDFIGEHQDLRLVSLTEAGVNFGYYVVFERKNRDTLSYKIPKGQY